MNCEMKIINIKNKSIYSYVLILVDAFTKKVFMKPLYNKYRHTIINNLMDIFKTYIPVTITSENTSTFNSYYVQDLFKQYNIKHNIIYNENNKKTFESKFETIISKVFHENLNWYDQVLIKCRLYNDTYDEKLNMTPNEFYEATIKEL